MKTYNYNITCIILLFFISCSNGYDKKRDTIPQDSTEANPKLTDSDSIDSTESETYEKGHICISNDGRISIESGVGSDDGTSPDYWAKWTITDDTGKKHKIMSPETYYQSKIHTITKTDGTVYYIVNCYDKACSSDGYEWLQAYKIVGDTIQEVNVADGGSKINNAKFSVNYNIPSWYFATNGAGYDWILDYDIHTKNLYVPVTTENRTIVDRYMVWHFDGNRFVCQGEKAHKNLHPSLADYTALIRYATTKDYILRVDSIDGKGLRYASWKKPKTMADKPDIIVKGGKRRHYEVAFDELHPCDDYRFYNNSFEYVVNYCEVKRSDTGFGGEHNDFLLIKQNGKVIIKQELDW